VLEKIQFDILLHLACTLAPDLWPQADTLALSRFQEQLRQAYSRAWNNNEPATSSSAATEVLFDNEASQFLRALILHSPLLGFHILLRLSRPTAEMPLHLPGLLAGAQLFLGLMQAAIDGGRPGDALRLLPWLLQLAPLEAEPLRQPIRQMLRLLVIAAASHASQPGSALSSGPPSRSGSTILDPASGASSAASFSSLVLDRPVSPASFLSTNGSALPTAQSPSLDHIRQARPSLLQRLYEGVLALPEPGTLPLLVHFVFDLCVVMIRAVLLTLAHASLCLL
jgi:hypothetical protein